MTPQENRTTITRDAEDSPSPTDIDVEVLGRQRPAVFWSWLSEVGFCSSLLGLMLMGVGLSDQRAQLWLLFG